MSTDRRTSPPSDGGSRPRMLLLPEDAAGREAVEGAGGEVADADDARVDGILLGLEGALPDLEAALERHPEARFVQLPMAGVDRFLDLIRAHPRVAFASAKGAYSEPVAEHALALALALLRELPRRARATSWGEPAATTLHRARVSVLGGGGIAAEFVRLLAPFDCDVTVIRRRASEPVEGARRVVAADELDAVLPETDVLMLAAALADDTRGLLDARRLGLLPTSAVIVNIARGPIIDTGALVDALAAGRLAGAALDVTDPEPLPEGHPLWREPRALITPHTADTLDMIRPLLMRRLAENVERARRGDELIGAVDAELGY